MIQHNGVAEPFMFDYLGKYNRQYHVEYSAWEGRRRNWIIKYEKPLFSLENSDGKVTHTYYDGEVVSCGCDDYFEKQTGTCMHGEIIKKYRSVLKQCIRDSVATNCEGVSCDENGIFLWTDGDSKLKLPGVEKYKSLFSEEKVVEYKDINAINLKLRDYQLWSCKKMLTSKKSVLTLKMGMGKTVCAINCLKILGCPKTLIICPSSLKIQWEREVQKHLGLKAKVLYKRADFGDLSQINIVNYELFVRHPLNNWDVVIIDEIQKVRNKQTKLWAGLSNLKTPRIFALSGTVIENKVEDLTSVLQIIDPNSIKPEWLFYSKYCKVRGDKVIGFKSEKLNKLKDDFDQYIVNPKVDISTFPVPKKNEFFHPVEMNGEQTAGHDPNFQNAMTLMSISENRPLTFSEQIALQGLLQRARLFSSDARLQNGKQKSSKIDIFKQISYKYEKIVVYSDWVKMLKLLTQEVNNYVEYHGEMSQKKRAANFEKFVEDKECKFFFSTDTGGVGLDGLQFVSNCVIHMESVWNPAKIDQRNARVCRALSKFSDVDIHYIFSEGGVEEMMNKSTGRKSKLRSDFFG